MGTFISYSFWMEFFVHNSISITIVKFNQFFMTKVFTFYLLKIIVDQPVWKEHYFYVRRHLRIGL
jgi:hypothetical protein